MNNYKPTIMLQSLASAISWIVYRCRTFSMKMEIFWSIRANITVYLVKSNQDVLSVYHLLQQIIFSHFRNKNNSERVWATTLAIDNPLSPQRRAQTDVLQQIQVFCETIDTLPHINKTFRQTGFVARRVGSLSACFFVIVLPASVLVIDVLLFDQYSALIYFYQIWLLIAAAFVIVAPPIEESFKQ